MGISAGMAMLISSVITTAGSLASAKMAKDASKTDDIAQITDKTTEQVAEEIDAPVTGDEASDRRKRQAAKDKFKIDTGSTGLNLGTTEGKTPGVQI